MDTNDDGILALLAKGLRDLRREFRALARLPGPSGADGRDGAAGTDGASGARGPAGADGTDGAPGRQGPAGADGRDGVDGQDGAIGPMPRHQWKGTELRFQQTPGRWGKYVDLQGPAGGGGVVVVGGGGGAGGIANNLPPASNTRPDGFVVRQGDKLVLASYSQMAFWFGSGGTAAFGLLTESGNQITTENGDSLQWE